MEKLLLSRQVGRIICLPPCKRVVSWLRRVRTIMVKSLVRSEILVAGTGEHLHFEVSPEGTGGYQQDEDPMPYVQYLQIGRYDGTANSDKGQNDTSSQGELSVEQPPKRSDFGSGRSGSQEALQSNKKNIKNDEPASYS